MALTKVKAGNILLTTPAASSNDVTPATTQYVTTALANMVDSAPSTLNTLNELAAALGDDANFSTTVTNSIAGKLPLAGGTMTGHLLLNNAVELRSKDTSSNIKTITRINNSNELEYGWSGSGPVKFMGGGAYTERMRIHTDGNIGIGTPSPSKLLHIKSADPVIRLEDSSPSAYAEIDGAGGDLIISCDAGNDDANSVMQFKVDNSEKMRINDAGDVGIGIAGPGAPLHVDHSSSTAYNGAAEILESVIIRNKNGTDNSGVNNVASLGLQVADGATSQGFINYIRTGNNTGKFSFSQRTGSSTYAEAMRINSSGHVDIPDQPGARLGIPSTQTITSSWSTVNFSDTDSADGMYNKGLTLSSGDITVPTAGRYFISARFRSEGTPFSAATQFEISVNNAASGGSYTQQVRLYINGNSQSAYEHAPPLDSILDLVAGARFRIRAKSDGSATFQLSSSSNTVCHLSIIKLA